MPSARREIVSYGITALASAGATFAFLHAMALSPDLFDAFTDSHTDNRIRFAQKNPITAFTSAVVVMPFVEEAIFRLAPALVLAALNKKDSAAYALTASLLSSGAFSLSHDFNPWTGVMHWNRIGTENLGHFAMGMLFWEINKRAGFKHAVTAHATMNASVLSAALRIY
ncbi:CPBP family intramembrane metalloprotease [Patescibacteria group bacterium]|nr:CPBP family intramembrane metalloprotease [Patescibacteria group bacterium]